MGMVRLFIAGDLCVRASVSGEVIPQELLSTMTSAAIRIVNLEGAIADNSRTPRKKAGVYGNQRQRADIGRVLTRERWDVALLANNHVTDYGLEGLSDTIEFLDKRGIAYLGAGNGCAAAYKPLVIEKNGVKIALVNAAEGQIGCMKNEETPYGFAWILHSVITQTIVQLRTECDLIIVLPHAGREFFDLPLPEWREIYRSLIDAGADTVVATHPHVIQGMERYRGKPIYYSLGNFFFNDAAVREPEWFNGMGVTLTFDTDKKEVLTEEVFFSVINDRISIKTALAEQFVARSAILAEARYTEYLGCVNERCHELWHTHYKSMLSCGPVSFLKKLRRMIINRSLKDSETLLYSLISTESHRFVIERALREERA